MGPKMVSCQNCGRQHPYEANFCISCGARLFKPLVKEQYTQSPLSVDRSDPSPTNDPVVGEEKTGSTFYSSFNNPPRTFLFVWSAISIPLNILVGAFFYLVSGKELGFTLWIVSMTPILPAISITGEYLTKPRKVEIGQSGILLHYRWQRSEFLPWYDIVWIKKPDMQKNMKYGGERSINKIMSRRMDKTVKLKDDPIPVTQEIATEVERAYFRHTGRYLPAPPRGV